MACKHLLRYRLNVATGATLFILLLLSMAGLVFHVRASEGAMRFSYETVVSGLNFPVAATDAGDGSGRLFITSKEGLVLIYDGTRILQAPFLDITALVSTFGERGLLSVAFHPSYGANGLFFVNYTNLDGNTIIARYRVSVDPNVANPSSASILLTIVQPRGNHNGGQLQFGPDGYLYAAMGDGGGAGNPFQTSQDPASLLGKMLRIDVDGPPPYGIPPDNPFVNDPATRDEIWSFGLRNPWRFSFDRLTGELFIGDVGQNAWEEIDYQPAGSPGGLNYGWSLMEGAHCFDPPVECNDGSLTLPIIEYSHNVGCSVTGGYRYRGSAIPVLHGIYLFADFCSGQVWGASRRAGRVKVVELFTAPFRINAFGQDEAGELYIVEYLPPDSSALHRITFVDEVSLDVAPVTAAVPAGGSLRILLGARNNTHLPQDLVFSTRVITPSGVLFPRAQSLFGPRGLTMEPFTLRNAQLSHAVPPNAPPGSYIYRAVLSRSGGEIVAEMETPFTILSP